MGHQIGPRRRDQGAKLLDKRQRIKQDGPGPVVERMAEPVANPAVLKAFEALGGYGGSGYVSTQPFQLLPAPPMDAHGRMERESVGFRTALPGKLDVTDARHPPFPLDIGSSFTGLLSLCLLAFLKMEIILEFDDLKADVLLLVIEDESDDGKGNYCTCSQELSVE